MSATNSPRRATTPPTRQETLHHPAPQECSTTLLPPRIQIPPLPQPTQHKELHQSPCPGTRIQSRLHNLLKGTPYRAPQLQEHLTLPTILFNTAKQQVVTILIYLTCTTLWRLSHTHLDQHFSGWIRLRPPTGNNHILLSVLKPALISGHFHVRGNTKDFQGLTPLQLDSPDPDIPHVVRSPSA